MKDGTIKVMNAINGQPFIVDACDTDATDTRQSTKDWVLEEISSVGMKDTLYDKMEEGIYFVYSTGGYDAYSGDSDFQMEFTKETADLILEAIDNGSLELS